MFTSIYIQYGHSGPVKKGRGIGIAQTGEAAAPTIHPEVRDMYGSPTAPSIVARREIAHILGADTQTIPNQYFVSRPHRAF